VVLTQLLPGGAFDIQSKYPVFRCQEVNLGPPKCRAGLLSTWLWCSKHSSGLWNDENNSQRHMECISKPIKQALPQGKYFSITFFQYYSSTSWCYIPGWVWASPTTAAHFPSILLYSVPTLNLLHYMRFEVLMPVNTNIMVSQDVMPCTLQIGTNISEQLS
jgi:hypothetical protein